MISQAKASRFKPIQSMDRYFERKLVLNSGIKYTQQWYISSDHDDGNG